EGAHSTANADYSHAEGANTIANGESSHAEGNSTITHGKNSHAEGSYTTTGNTDDILLGDSAHAEGIHTTAEAIASHAEGIYTIAAGTASHAEGNFTVAYGDSAHAEGYFTVAEGKSTHAEGIYTIAQGKASHVEGAHTAAVGDFSHAEGVGNFSKFKGAHIMGKYGDSQEAYSWFIGNGVSPNNKELGAKWLASTRNMYIDGSTYVANGTNYAEMFEVRNGTIDVGFFVTLDGEFIRKATAQDEYILGITNDSPSILGNSAEMRWKEKYLVDEWGRIQFENINDSGAIEKRAILNPKWSPEKKYISRIERSEWVAVGLLGQMRVRDDGKCVVGSYCLPNMEGIATSSNTGYRVIKRITPNQIMIIFK
ncbi:peptidase G2 autoproteolytic cleavage domain-containing protein, partial [Bacillus cereus]|uniref:peptidase G2 autoproteolytic cleavage domain-containing protein n=1 Tax=Bacillus cereus TaxID=1396 RepID=UPI003D65ECD1